MNVTTLVKVAESSQALTAFGPEAERIARRCAPTTSLLLCDGSHVAEALAHAVQRRRKGDQYLVMPILNDTMSVVARLAATSIYEQFSNADQRRQLFELLACDTLQFNELPVSKHQIYTPQILNTMREISQLGDGLYVRSFTERTRVETMFGRKRLYVAVAPLIDTSVPSVLPNRDATHILVWAPNEEAKNLAIYSYALWHLQQPAIFVCRGEIPGSPHHFVAPDRAAEGLAQAAIIIDTQISDPGTAIAFADRGYGLVTASTSGAHEYIQGVATYYMHDFSSIYGAATRARADRRAFALYVPNADMTIRNTVIAAQPPIPPNPPLISMIMPTYNRRELLRKGLELFSKQDYPNFEVVVVNDCGEDVSDIVAQFPFARHFCTPKNSGTSIAVNYGLRAARGEYLGLIADDDADYVSQMSSLAAALLSSGVDIAHGNIILRLDTKLPDGLGATYGHLLDHDGDHDAWSVHWGMPIALQSMLIRRDAFESVGFLGEHTTCTSDIDLILKLSAKCDFAHVGFVTGEMSYRDDKSNLSSKVGVALADEIHATQTFYAPSDSEVIRQRIEQNAHFIRQAQQMPTFFHPWVRLETMISLADRE